MERQVQLRKLSEVTRQLTMVHSTPEVLALAARRATELLDASRAVLGLLEPDGDLRVVAAHGLPEVPERVCSDGSLDGPLATVLDVERCLAVPLVIGGRVQGLLAVDVDPARRPDDHDEWLLSALADQAALALDRSELQDQAQLRERMLAVVGHDLRNPLNALGAMAGALSTGALPPDRTTELGAQMQQGVRRMAGLLDVLIDFTHAWVGHGLAVSPEPVDLLAACRAVAEELGHAHPDAQVTVAGEPVQGRWDPERLHQLLSNLAANAVHHGERGGPVTVTVGADDQVATVRIHNRGAPIPEALRAHLFEPFRVHDRRSRRQSLGLGLFIAREIAQAHSGTLVLAASDEARGTTFELRLPR
ncbi:MAG: HAMP domain-containing sensor histidine kinase [Myxococcota bacterium]